MFRSVFRGQFRDLLREAYGAMRHNRRRTALTMLGMASWNADRGYAHSGRRGIGQRHGPGLARVPPGSDRGFATRIGLWPLQPPRHLLLSSLSRAATLLYHVGFHLQ